MKKLAILFVSALLLANTAISSAESDLGSIKMSLADGASISISKFIGENGIGLRASSASGEKLAEVSGLGSEDKLFILGKETTGLALKDLNNDGNPEILAAAFYGPASGLYAFNYDAGKKQLVAIKCLNETDPELSSECVASDIRQDDGQDLVISDDGSVRALGMIYPSDPGAEAVAGFFTYRLDNGAFKLAEKKPVPVD
jgi:hypothetical protein